MAYGEIGEDTALSKEWGVKDETKRNVPLNGPEIDRIADRSCVHLSAAKPCFCFLLNTIESSVNQPFFQKYNEVQRLFQSTMKYNLFFKVQ